MAGTAGHSGRYPGPTARRGLVGNPGKRTPNKEEPAFTSVKGVASPDWSSEDDNPPMATIMWKLTTEKLYGQGLLYIVDLAVFERWCVACEFWRRVVKDIIRERLTIIGAVGGKIKSPELTAKREQGSEMSSTGSILDLDPSDRQRLVGLTGQKKTSSPLLKMISS